MTEYKIEKGIKIPFRRNRGVWVDIFDKMKVGDSIKLPHREAFRFQQSVSHHGGEYKLKLRQHLPDRKMARVWKVKR